METTKYESDIESYLFGKVKKLKGLCRKMEGSESGWPDRLVILPGGIVFFAELKRDKTGELSSLQRALIRKLERLGMTVYVPKTKKEINEMLETELEKGREKADAEGHDKRNVQAPPVSETLIYLSD